MPWPYKDWPDALLHALQTQVGGEEIKGGRISLSSLFASSREGVDDASPPMVVKHLFLQRASRKVRRPPLPAPTNLDRMARQHFERLLIQHVSFELGAGSAIESWELRATFP